ncbi:MAG TPA: 3-oxoacyl-ACP reductase FabG [Oligoflexia bacterium]|nr:3-oxoacyl-ACP reductase FabG [Oligoflexia bacterium]HMP49870.1 3-oxoacyl-ACP reductase FabG [Oligoflexia bacterium]
MNKRVLVTGSSRGIGKSIAITLLKSGFDVVFHGRTQSDSLLGAAEEMKGFGYNVRALFFDVVDRALSREILEAEVKERGAFYGVVLSAGIHRDMPFPGMLDEAWDDVLKVDLFGFYNVLRPLVMPMIQLRSGGRIVCISSLSGIVGNRGQVNYSAAKAGLIGASRALSRELAKRKITVNCVAPGGVETEMIDDNLREQMLKAIPMGRLARPEEIAASVSYLFSEEAEYMTGQTLVLSGGLF